MNTMSTRIAPVGAHMMHALATRQATASPVLTLQVRGGQALQFASQAEMVAAVRRMSVSNASPDPVPSPPNPAPTAPITSADTAARLDAQDAQLADHEARIAGLEHRSPPPAVDTGAQAAPPAAAAAAIAVAPVSRMISSTEIYARMNGRPTGAKAPAAATTATPASVMIQTKAGPILNARAIHDRNNAAAARAGLRR